jgi:hypothetical protein
MSSVMVLLLAVNGSWEAVYGDMQAVNGTEKLSSESGSGRGVTMATATAQDAGQPG